MGIVKGKKLMVFVKEGSGNYVSVAYATNHTFSTSASTVDVSHKDLADVDGGRWDDQDVDVLSWNITTENLYSVEGEGHTFADLFNLYAAGTVLDVKFGLAGDSSTGVPTGGWQPESGSTAPEYLSGKAIITALDLNAANGEKASFTATFTGKGPLSVA